MQSVPIEDRVMETVVAEMAASELFGNLAEDSLRQIAGRAVLNVYEPGETIVEERSPSDFFLLILGGEAAVTHLHISSERVEEMGRMGSGDVIGEIGLLLNLDRTATVRAVEPTRALRFDQALFQYMFDNIPNFGMAISQNLARRLQQVSSFIPLPAYDSMEEPPDPRAAELLPVEFVVRHRVLPLKTEGNRLYVGFMNDPTPRALSALRRFLPSMELRLVHIDMETFDQALRTRAGLPAWSETEREDSGTETEETPPGEAVESPSPRLDQLLRRMVAEGASDLHLSAAHVPHWRIDGEIRPIEDTAAMGPEEVLELLLPVLDDDKRLQFQQHRDADFVYPLPETARFRVNVFQDDNGVGAVFRFIPSQVLNFEQLGLPMTLQRMCDHPKGLVLVTGPTGSGKSTTLAAMIDYINRTRRAHIITMEDPIEFTYRSDQCLINQREVGRHAESFTRALRAALREDPDIVLVGEMRDLETISLALETANTGHLVFATLHTATAVSTMSRIIDSFPADQRNQVRNSLCDSLKGVVAQTLLRRIGGGRIAAIETLVVNVAVANLIREEKFNQIESSMQTGRAQGNRLLNDELARLVRQHKVEYAEALASAVDKAGLEKRLEDEPHLLVRG